MTARTAGERALVARIAACERWAHVDDRVSATAKARQAFMDRFEREADPEGTLQPDERARRGALLKRAHFARLALKSGRKRGGSGK